jgi:glycosyltransferase involved in cell wall biosynthesis
MNTALHSQKVPALSLIIAVYNRAQALEMIFASLSNQTFSNFEVLIADDGSDEPFEEIIGRYQPAFLHPIRHVRQEHRGFRKTVIVNKAADCATSSYLVFIDGDCILHHRFLERHFVRRSPGVVLSGRRVELSSELTSRVTLRDVQSRRIESPLFWWKGSGSYTRRRGLYVPYIFHFRRLSGRNYRILGSNFSIFKSDFLAVNGYDERIISRGMEDSNLNERLVLHGCVGRNVSGEAIQYHLFHHFDPVAHRAEALQQFCSPAGAWTPYGIKKSDSAETGRPSPAIPTS